MRRSETSGWKLTMGLSLLALVAAVIVPRLTPVEPPADPGAEADVCLRLGPYECCYKEDEP